MLGLELVVILCAAVLAANALGSRLSLAPPILLLLIGILLGFVPALRTVQLPPEVVLLLFLPALLYWESLTTSPREIGRNARGVILTGTVLVIVTAAAVAVAAHALGLPWGPAWVLGAAVAPTDATAVGVLARMLPRRDITLLRAESLINDGTALVVYGLAVGITVGEEHLSPGHVGRLFLLAYGGGAAAGALVAWLGLLVRRRLTDPTQGAVAMLLIPFAAFLLAEAIEASGVLAVVVCGLIMSQAGPRIGRPGARLQTQSFYIVATFLLNGSLFVLIGLELRPAARDLSAFSLARALIIVIVVIAVLVSVRFAFLFGSAYAIRLLDRRLRQRSRADDRALVVSGVSGFRGAVSLAAALAIPNALASGAPFPYRDTIVFATAVVIIVTLVVQGILLPVVVRWASLPRDTGVRDERRLAETLATEEALAALPDVAAELHTDPDVAERLSREYQTHLLVVRAGETAEAEEAVRHDREYTALRLALIARKRATVLRLRDERRIDDTVLRQLQAVLDIEEVRLSHRPTPD